MTIEERPWRLVACAGADDSTLVGVPVGVDVTATFADGRVSGRGGCNRYSGEYSLVGTALTIGPLASTMMACPEPQMAVEAAFFAAMARASRIVSGDGTLELLDETGGTVLRFVADVVWPLVGTHWQATGINNGRGGVESPLAGTTVTARFDTEGRVAGGAGCNRYTASYAAAGASITIGPAGVTRRLCGEPDGVMGQEAAFLAALARAAAVRIDRDVLELRDDGGALQVSFVAVAT